MESGDIISVILIFVVFCLIIYFSCSVTSEPVNKADTDNSEKILSSPTTTTTTATTTTTTNSNVKPKEENTEKSKNLEVSGEVEKETEIPKNYFTHDLNYSDNNNFYARAFEKPKLFPETAPTQKELDIQHNWIRIGKSSIPDAGMGVFATRDIPEGAWIGYYRGEVVADDAELKRRYPEGLNVYTLGITPVKSEPAIRIDASEKWGNWTRYINDNLEGKHNCAYQGDSSIVMIKDVKAGDELFVSYGSGYWETWKRINENKKNGENNKTTAGNDWFVPYYMKIVSS